MAAKVKYPVRAALARFTPIYNHLTNMADYLDQAGYGDLAVDVRSIERELGWTERKIKPLREK